MQNTEKKRAAHAITNLVTGYTKHRQHMLNGHGAVNRANQKTHCFLQLVGQMNPGNLNTIFYSKIIRKKKKKTDWGVMAS